MTIAVAYRRTLSENPCSFESADEADRFGKAAAHGWLLSQTAGSRALTAMDQPPNRYRRGHTAAFRNQRTPGSENFAQPWGRVDLTN